MWGLAAGWQAKWMRLLTFFCFETTFAWLHYLISQMNWLIATAADAQWVFQINLISFLAKNFGVKNVFVAHSVYDKSNPGLEYGIWVKF